MIKSNYNENTMPLGRDPYENNVVQHQGNQRRKYAIQNDEGYNLSLIHI